MPLGFPSPRVGFARGGVFFGHWTECRTDRHPARRVGDVHRHHDPSCGRHAGAALSTRLVPHRRVRLGPFPAVDQGRWPVSRAGGTEPLWAPSGGELFCLAADGALMAVPLDAVKENASFAPGTSSRAMAPGAYRTRGQATPAARTTCLRTASAFFGSRSKSAPQQRAGGRWLLYVSDEHLYVRPFPGPGREARITRNRGTAPIWAPNGRSVLFLDPSETGSPQIMRLPVGTSGDRVVVGNPAVLATGPFGASTPVGGFDVTPDGSRLLVLLRSPAPEPGATQPSVLRLIVHADLSGVW